MNVVFLPFDSSGTSNDEDISTVKSGNASQLLKVTNKLH